MPLCHNPANGVTHIDLRRQPFLVCGFETRIAISNAILCGSEKHDHPPDFQPQSGQAAYAVMDRSLGGPGLANPEPHGAPSNRLITKTASLLVCSFAVLRDRTNVRLHVGHL
jgi:hypothetical protein